MVLSNPNNLTILKPAWKSLPPKSHFILSALFHLPERQAHCRIFSNLLAFVPAVGVLMFLLAVRSQALAFCNQKKKSVFSSVLWSRGFTAWCVSPDSICSLPSTLSSILMACPFCTHRLVKVEYRDEVALPWSEGEPGRGESCSRLSSASQPSCSRNAGGVYKPSVQCCDVATVLRSNSCGMVKGTFNKTPTIYHVVFLRSWVATGVITLMELERYHAAVVFITVWPLFIALLLLGPLLCFPLGAKHS